MFKKEIKNRLLITLAWLVVVSLIRWRLYLPFFSQAMSTLGLWLGGLIGIFLVDLDHWLYLLVIHPQEPVSLKIKGLIKTRRFKEVLDLFYQTHGERLRLAFHSAVFQPILYLLCFFVITSTSNLLGVGMVMVMALQLLNEELTLLLKGKDEELKKWLFWQLDIRVTLRQQKVFVFSMLVVFLALHLLII